MTQGHRQPVYDHRLRALVRETGDVGAAAEAGVPRSTAAGWLRGPPVRVVSLDVLSMREKELQAAIVKLHRRLGLLRGLLGIFVAVVRAGAIRHRGVTLLDERFKAVLLRGIERTRECLPLRSILRIVGVSPSRFHGWVRELRPCQNADRGRCPRTAPNQLILQEVGAIRTMVISPDYRHVPTGRLAVLAQRLR